MSTTDDRICAPDWKTDFLSHESRAICAVKRVLAVLVLAVAMGSCAQEPDPMTSESSPQTPDMVRHEYPSTRAADQVDEYHGIRVA
ncbi:MAG: hypothetical protein V3S71_07965, partial [Acidobacteriota bacterium]